MRIFVMVNQVRQLVRGQTTVALIHAAARLGHEVGVFSVGELSLQPHGEMTARAYVLQPEVPPDRGQALLRLRASEPRRMALRSGDVVLIRTNPGRDKRRSNLHHMALELCIAAQRRGVSFANAPGALLENFGKLSLDLLPERLRAPMLVSRNDAEIIDFIRAQPTASVLKPLWGSRGASVFALSPKDENLAQVVELNTANGYVVVQPFLADGPKGCVRVITLGDRIFEVDGDQAVFNRVPPEGEFRSNVSLGTKPQRVILTPEQAAAATEAAVALHGRGFFMIGVDLVGQTIVECNVFSPGGLNLPARYHGRDFATPALERLLQLAGASPPVDLVEGHLPGGGRLPGLGG